MTDMNFENPKSYPGLVLAYIGDAVYEVYVRGRIVCEHGDMPPNKLHKESIKHVKAQAQSNAVKVIEPLLTEEEEAAYKRGRNAKSTTVPKNADVADYRRSTGLEALFGYLYMKKETERLEELMKLAYENSKDVQL